jgi:hypothetical protein
LGTIDNQNSGGITEPAYSDLSGTYSTNLIRGVQHGLSIEGGDFAPDSYAAWIDYDGDEVFEAAEKLGEFETNGANETGTIQFTVPANTPLGPTRMRVRGVYLGSGEPTPVDPCFPYAFGETEDYGIIIETSTEIRSFSSEGVKLYPNPSAGLVHVELEAKGATLVDVFDPQGRSVARYQQVTERLTLDLTGLASGAYHVRIQQGQITSTHRIEVITEN